MKFGIFFETVGEAETRVSPADETAANGYAVLSQDGRGRFGSEGDYYPVVTEA